MKSKGNLIIISGPSGSGKGTVCRSIVKELPDLHISISATTRKPRGEEKDGIEYYFLTRASFEEMIAGDRLLEWAEVYGNYYGTPRVPVEEKLSQGLDVVLEIDVQGALQVKNKFPGCVLIFLIPPSRSVMQERLVNRGTDSMEEINRRLDWTKKEIKEVSKYDYLVVNDKLEDACCKIVTIINAERCRPALMDVESFLQRNW